MTREEPLLTSEEFAKYLGISVHTVSKYRSKGIGPRYILLRQNVVRYKKSDIDEWVNDMIAKNRTS